MAVYNEILVGRFNRALQKLFAIKGGPPVPQLSSEIIAIHPMASGVENRYLEGWNRWWGIIPIAAVAAQFNTAQMRNPASSNVIGVVEQISLADSGAGQLVALSISRAPQADLATIMTMASMDSRVQATAAAITVSFSAASVAVFPQSVQQYSLPTGLDEQVILTDDQEITLLPGDTLRFTTSTVNTTSRFNLKWRERFLEDSERA